jgi:pimeloyl-ACP methyl ester carboxylesterase
MPIAKPRQGSDPVWGARPLVGRGVWMVSENRVMTTRLRMLSVVLLHGAGSGPEVFAEWPAALPGHRVVAVDMQTGLDVSHVSMEDYRDVVVHVAETLPAPRVLCGWSMGGLVAMMAAQRVAVEQLVVIEPSPPAEVQGRHDGVEMETGTFDPEDVYGPFAAAVRPRPEARLAHSQRKAGISVPTLPPSTLVVYGDEFRQLRGTAIAARYGCASLYIPGTDHMDLVLDSRVPALIADWLMAREPSVRRGGSGVV